VVDVRRSCTEVFPRLLSNEGLRFRSFHQRHVPGECAQDLVLIPVGVDVRVNDAWRIGDERTGQEPTGFHGGITPRVGHQLQRPRVPMGTHQRWLRGDPPEPQAGRCSLRVDRLLWRSLPNAAVACGLLPPGPTEPKEDADGGGGKAPKESPERPLMRQAGGVPPVDPARGRGSQAVAEGWLLAL